ncbi:hypothetical protein AUR64_15100 [Haloprofundus marisrubri]|uniref:Ig-like domain-containing protein n=1 Tax=Haloprofundus marisrubri TaxID=1514971 RepID=A0A0W1R7M2_9EURY|nr:hypothetical protein [Haloprofundus marisrubri]KTG09122.1 hypothetical protein AUR64_15100 [Haloprofundus marisrubri]
MRRRTVLAAVVAGLGTTAGCGGRLFDEERTDSSTTTSPEATAEPSDSSDSSASTTSASAADPRSNQRIAVRNLRREATYVTLVVERAADGETMFAESRTFPTGQERRFPEIPLAEGEYRVIVETDTGERATFEWTVAEELEGLAIDVDESETTFRRFVRCRPDCSLSLGGETSESLPLSGSGLSLWYQPAVVVLDNPTAEERRARLRVSLSDRPLFDFQYRVPAQSRLTVPTTYRRGTYSIVVDEERENGDDQRTETEWRVPEEFEKQVDLGPTHRVSCGKANPVLWLTNRSDERRAVRIHVTDERGETVFDERRSVAADERRAIRPVSDAGQYELTVETESGETASTTWWACPPHSLITVLVDDDELFLD